MKTKLIITLTAIGALYRAQAHPGGNMIVFGEQVIWSYIHPIEDTDHHACIMSWRPGLEPEAILTSEFPASDFMFYTNQK